MGQQCCYQPPTDIYFDGNKFQSKSLQISSKNLFQQKTSKNVPDQNFALPINKVPQLSEPIRQRRIQLGPFERYTNLSGEKLGPYKLSNGIIYDGQWKNGKMNGKGTYYLPGGQFLETTTQNNVISAPGRLIRVYGDYYEGDIAQNQAHGYGTYINQNLIYKGEFKYNLKHGNGQQIGKDYKFKGKYINDQRVQGKIIYGQNYQNIYQGSLKNNQFHGFGKLQTQAGIYQGQFKNGSKDGSGKFIWKDGHMFMGMYQNNKKNGYGILCNPQKKQVRSGVWKDDKFVS